MRCGISTACFFPEDTRLALNKVIELGSPITEVFLNTVSEMEPAYVAALQDAVETSGIEVVSVHPCLSMLDGYFFASPYEARYADGERLFRRFFEICRLLGARFLVFHGDHAHNSQQFSQEAYAHNFRRLAEVGCEYAVTLCHENVSYCRLGAPGAVEALKPLLKESAAFVLDLKQCLRNDVSIEAMARAMGSDIRHVHISDNAGRQLCLPPGQGMFDFPAFFEQLRALDASCDMVIELYSDGYKESGELGAAMLHLQGILRQQETWR